MLKQLRDALKALVTDIANNTNNHNLPNFSNLVQDNKSAGISSEDLKKAVEHVFGDTIDDLHQTNYCYNIVDVEDLKQIISKSITNNIPQRYGEKLMVEIARGRYRAMGDTRPTDCDILWRTVIAGKRQVISVGRYDSNGVISWDYPMIKQMINKTPARQNLFISGHAN